MKSFYILSRDGPRKENGDITLCANASFTSLMQQRFKTKKISLNVIALSTYLLIKESNLDSNHLAGLIDEKERTPWFASAMTSQNVQYTDIDYHQQKLFNAVRKGAFAFQSQRH